MEKSFSTAKDELAAPARLELPLSLGVKVIAAHIATTGKSEGQNNTQTMRSQNIVYEARLHVRDALAISSAR